MATLQEDINRILRDHEGYSGDGQGHSGALPVGDPSTPAKPISKHDLRTVLMTIATTMGDPGALQQILSDLGQLQGAVDDLGSADNAGKVFQSRSGAVTYGQANLPAKLDIIFTLEGSTLVVRVPGTGDDDLFETSPYWSAALRIDLDAIDSRIDGNEGDIRGLQQNTVRTVAQKADGVIPARPAVPGSVHWWCWDDPTEQMRPMDVWVKVAEPLPPDAPDGVSMIDEMVVLTRFGAHEFVLENIPVSFPEIAEVELSVDGGLWQGMTIANKPMGGREARLEVFSLPQGTHDVIMRFGGEMGKGPQSMIARKVWAITGSTAEINFSDPVAVGYDALHYQRGLWLPLEDRARLVQWRAANATNGVPAGVGPTGRNNGGAVVLSPGGMDAAQRFGCNDATVEIFLVAGGGAEVGVRVQSYQAIVTADGAWKVFAMQSNTGENLLANGSGVAPGVHTVRMKLDYNPTGGRRTETRVRVWIDASSVFDQTYPDDNTNAISTDLTRETVGLAVRNLPLSEPGVWAKSISGSTSRPENVAITKLTAVY